MVKELRLSKWMTALFAVVPWILTPVEANAQGGCGYCHDSYQGGFQHSFGGQGAIVSCSPNTCHFYSYYPDLCTDFHTRCADELARGATVGPAELEMIRRAVVRLDELNRPGIAGGSTP